MTSREQFEVWFNPKKAEMQAKGVGSLNIVMSSRTAWAAWQASREAVEVVLPPAINTEEIGRAISKEKTMTRLALAGIKVKGE